MVVNVVFLGPPADVIACKLCQSRTVTAQPPPPAVRLERPPVPQHVL